MTIIGYGRSSHVQCTLYALNARKNGSVTVCEKRSLGIPNTNRVQILWKKVEWKNVLIQIRLFT